MNSNNKLSELQEKLADLKKRWPAHSVKPQMVEEMERLEEEIESLKQGKSEAE